MRRSHGVTLVELLLALALIGVVVAALSGLLTQGAQRFAQVDARASARETALGTFTALREAMSDTTNYRITTGCAQVIFETGTGRGELDYSMGRLMLLTPGAPPVLLASDLADYSVHPLNAALLRIRLVLRRPASTAASGPTTVAFTDEVFLSAVGGGTLDAPWNPLR